MLEPLLGSEWAPLLFGVALVAAGQSSTVTGTLAGQIVMEGYLNLRIAPWLRRLLTRLIAIIPAYVVILLYGEAQTGTLLVFSQVVLSLQLGFAIIPLIHFTSDREKMGEFVIKPWMKIAAWLIAAIVVSLNAKLVVQEIAGWLETAGDGRIWIWIFVIPACLGAAALLLYITLFPLVKKPEEKTTDLPHGQASELQNLEQPVYERIAICIDFTKTDELAIRSALAQGGSRAHYALFHVVESAGAMVYGDNIADRETDQDWLALEDYANQLRVRGFNVISEIDYGSPKNQIPKMVTRFKADMLVMGAHGHNWFNDLIFGTTVDAVRHRVNIPVFIVKQR